MKGLFFIGFMFTSILTTTIDFLTAFSRKKLHEAVYCEKKGEAFSVLNILSREFWKKALSNPFFNNAINLQSDRLKLKSPKIIFKIWKKHVFSLADGLTLTTSKNEKDIFKFVEHNGSSFYNVIQIISQHIDFSNKNNIPFLSILVTDVAGSLPISKGYYNKDLPGHDFIVVETVLRKAIKIEDEIKKHHLDKFTFEGVSRQQVKEFVNTQRKILRELNDISATRALNFDDFCYSNGMSSRLLHNNGENSLFCNDDWLRCITTNVFIPPSTIVNNTMHNQYNLLNSM